MQYLRNDKSNLMKRNYLILLLTFLLPVWFKVLTAELDENCALLGY